MPAKSVGPITPPDPPPFTRAQTFRWMELIKVDPWWASQMPVGIVPLQSALGLPHRHDFREVIRPGDRHYTPGMIDRISRIIPKIESRHVCFPHKVMGWRKPGELDTKFIFLEPVPLGINRICISHNWSLWAFCLSCGNNKFMPVMMNGKKHVACYNCIPPDQYRALGATMEKGSLIHEALKKYY